MIATMIDIHERRETVLVVVLEKDNLDRMEKADPVTLESVSIGGWLPIPAYPLRLSMLIAYEKDSEEVQRRARGDSLQFLAWLERNRQFIRGLDGVSHVMKIPKDGKQN